MPGCAAVGCTNSSQKGFFMKKFPKDPKRREQWRKNINRANWIPTDTSVLCEIHFEARMWEKTREDGTRKLKITAVPTILPNSSNKTPRKSKEKRQMNENVDIPTTVQIPDKEIVLHDYLYTSLSSPSNSLVESRSETSPIDFDKYLVNMNDSQKGVGSIESQTVENIDILVMKTEPDSDTEMQIDNFIGRNTETLTQMEEQIVEDTKHELLRVTENRVLKETKRKLSRSKNVQKKYLKMSRKGIKIQGRKPKRRKSFKKLNLLNIFNKDQMLSLQPKISTSSIRWSSHTVKKALKLLFECGLSGYKELLKQNLPYPALINLQEHFQYWNFDNGISDDLFDFLKMKFEKFPETKTDCVLFIDEKPIVKTSMGQVTFPKHTGLATHVLIFMLAGVKSNWKQIVAFYFIKKNLNGFVFHGILSEIFKKAFAIGLDILSITSDVEICNRTLWETFGITTIENRVIINSTENPVDFNKRVYFMADVRCLFKRFEVLFCWNKIVLSNFIQAKYKLPTNFVSCHHVHDLLRYQNKSKCEVHLGLSEADFYPVFSNDGEVCLSSNIFKHDVSSALQIIADQENKSEYLTTAWFIDLVVEWIKMVTNNSPVNALSKTSEVYSKTISFLTDFIEIIHFMDLRQKSIWKIVQTGFLVTTESILDLHIMLLDEKKYDFVLTGHFSPECIKKSSDIFYNKQIKPNVLVVKNYLKTLCVLQYLHDTKENGNEEDEETYLLDFVKSIKRSNKLQRNEVRVPADICDKFTLNYTELNSLYNVAGYIVDNVRNNFKTCDNCINSVGSSIPFTFSFGKFSTVECKKNESSFYCYETVFYFFIDMEHIFRKFYDIICERNFNVKKFYMDKMKTIDTVIVNDCHKLKDMIISSYVMYRLKTGNN